MPFYLYWVVVEWGDNGLLSHRSDAELVRFQPTQLKLWSVGQMAKPPDFLSGYCWFESNTDYIASRFSVMLAKLFSQSFSYKKALYLISLCLIDIKLFHNELRFLSIIYYISDAA